MAIAIARSSGASQRVFPPVAADLYRLKDADESQGPDQQVARALLSLAGQELPRLQWWTGWRLAGSAWLARLLRLHKLGLEAELAGTWSRAGHFWESLQEELGAVVDRADLWQQAAESTTDGCGETVMKDPRELRQRLVHEVFVDTHCAFFNAHLQAEPQPTWKNRAFAHIDYIRGLIDLEPVSKEDIQTLLAPGYETWIELCEESKEWERARELCRTLLHYLPDVEEYQDRLARLHLQRTLAKQRKAKSARASRRNAAVLRKGISDLGRMMRDYPYSLGVYEALAVLHEQLAINEANAGTLSDAILSAQMAVAYNPSLKQAQETRAALVGTMLRLQEQMKQVQARLAHQPRARLTPQGVQMANEARRGLWPAESFAKLDAPRITNAFYAAQGRRLWRDLGLPEPSERWDESSRALLAAMSQVLAEEPGSPDEVTTAWDGVAAEKPELAGLDAAPICNYLEGRMSGEEAAPVRKPPTVAGATPQQPQLIRGLSAQPQKGREPFAIWLFSRRDRRVKVQALVAFVLIAVAFGMGVRDLLVRAARNSAYAQLTTAAGNEELIGIIQAAEAYFAHTPLSGRDPRDADVQALYTGAFVRWFARLETEPDSEAQAHIDRYRALIVDAKQRGGEQP